MGGDPIRDMFEQTATELFAEAGVDPKLHPDRFHAAVRQLSLTMAMCSALYGLSEKRVQVYDSAKDKIVAGLKQCAGRPM